MDAPPVDSYRGLDPGLRCGANGTSEGPRLVTARHGAQGDVEAIPRVDGHHGHRQVDELLLTEPGTDRLVDVIRNPILSDQCQRLGPEERRPFAVCVERGLAPGIEEVEALLAFTAGAGFLG